MTTEQLTSHAAFLAASYCCIIPFLLVLIKLHRSTARLPLPPGPRALPFIGNVHQLPEHYQHETFAGWAKEYGDVLCARFFGRDIVVLSSADVARLLMEKRGAKYSGRPSSTFFTELGSFEYNLGFMTYGDRWRRHRKWFQYGFQVKSRLDGYIPVQERETHRLLADLLDAPDEFMVHIKRFAAALMLEIGYAHSVTSIDDEHIKMADTAVQGLFEVGTPGAVLMDVFPILKYVPAWLPGAEWKRNATQLRPAIDTMNRKPFRRVVVMEAVAAGTAHPSLATAILQEAPPGAVISEAEEKEMSGVVGVVYSAGTDTTVTVLGTFVLAMILNPDIYLKAQVEVDCVISSDRLPNLDDRPTLPYLECILKEVYRWGAPIPLGVAHQLTEADEYKGYMMPESATVISNIWAMTRDEHIYPDPETFDPERHLNISPSLSELRDSRKIVFGFGRRTCPSRFFGDANAWLAMAKIVATLDIRAARDSTGHEVMPPATFASGLIRHQNRSSAKFDRGLTRACN